MRRRPAAAVLAVAALTTTLLPGPLPTASAVAAPAKPYDLNGDGFAELVIGSPWLSVAGQEDAGGFAVLRGSRKGLSRSVQLVTRASPGVPGDPTEDEGLGYSVASADFDRDGYADLVVAQGWPSNATVRGRLLVVPGSRRGLDLAHSVSIDEPAGEPDDGRWADELATGDLDGDGFPDLAVGDGPPGRVWVFPGGTDGLHRTPSATLDNPGTEIGFGGSLATGDVDQDGVADLVVGSYGYQVNDWGLPGAISLCLGRRGAGVTGCRPLVSDEYELANLSTLAVGDVTGDGRPEVVAGDEGWSDEATGAVHVYRLSGSGSAITAEDRVLTQSSRGIPGGDEREDRFGQTVALADLDHDGREDLVIGSPGENDGRGRVTIVHGAPNGWATKGNTILDLATRGVPGRPGPDDWFGSDLALLDHDGDGRVDLDVVFSDEKGHAYLTTLRGARGGLTTRGARTSRLRELDTRVQTARTPFVLGR